MLIQDFKESNFSVSSSLVTLDLIGEKELEGESYKWLNDREVTIYMDKGYEENTKEEQRAYYKQMMESDTDILFSIRDNLSNAHIGNVGFHNIDSRHNKSSLGILIGDKNYWKGGYAFEVTYNLIKIGFNTLRFNKIYGNYMVGNDAPKYLWKYIGFTEDGVLKQHYLKNGKYIDACIISMLRENWIKKIKPNSKSHIDV